jgi:putative molybdopterin biosynthesis protein
MVAAGNPRGITGLRDLAGLRLAYRPVGTGTRALFDELAVEAGLSAAALAGHGLEESTHLAVAAAVAAGAADVGFGIHAAAAAHGLGFVPMIVEHYFLVCEAPTLDMRPAALLIDVLRSPDWKAVLDGLPGYGAEGAGEVVSLRRTLPWLGPKRNG